MSEKEALLVKQLLEKTQAKAINWEPTAQFNSFVAPFRGDVTFTVYHHEGHQYEAQSYGLIMRDKDDREMLRLDSVDNSVNHELEVNLTQLYRAAHDSALKVEETLDSILDDLRKVS